MNSCIRHGAVVEEEREYKMKPSCNVPCSRNILAGTVDNGLIQIMNFGADDVSFHLNILPEYSVATDVGYGCGVLAKSGDWPFHA